MPDLTLCQGRTCEVRQTCWRFTTLPGYRPEYTAFWQTPGFTPEAGCTYRIPVRVYLMANEGKHEPDPKTAA